MKPQLAWESWCLKLWFVRFHSAMQTQAADGSLGRKHWREHLHFIANKLNCVLFLQKCFAYKILWKKHIATEEMFPAEYLWLNQYYTKMFLWLWTCKQPFIFFWSLWTKAWSFCLVYVSHDASLLTNDHLLAEGLKVNLCNIYIHWSFLCKQGEK